MPNTFTAARRHSLIRVDGRRTIHAAILVEGNNWRTACGETFPAERTTSFINPHYVLETETESLCRRCDRVGNSL